MRNQKNPMDFSRVTITPEMAEGLLAKNTNNRHVSEYSVGKLVAAMTNGEWVFNGDAIRVADNGQLLDGQHRLIACIESGVPFETMVISGLPASVFTTIDTGRSRTAGDALSMMGMKYANHTAAAVRWHFALTENKVQQMIHVSNDQVVEFVKKHPEICDYVAYASAKKIMLPWSLVAAFMMKAVLIDEEATFNFIDDFASGAGLEIGDPVLVLRGKLIAQASLKQKIKLDDKLAMLINAWNARRTKSGRKLVKGMVKSPLTGKVNFPPIL